MSHVLLSRHTSSQGILAADGKTVEKLVELPELIIEQQPIKLDSSSWYIAKYSEYRALHDNGSAQDVGIKLALILVAYRPLSTPVCSARGMC